MKLLLTSAGVKNPSIHEALVEMLAKPIEESAAICIPTAGYAHGGFRRAWDFVAGRASTPMVELGWQSLSLMELSVLPSLKVSQWLPALEEADILLVNGGDAVFLNYWMRQSGVAEHLSSLPEALVYLGLSGGSMVMAPRIGVDFMHWQPPTGSDETLGVVPFSIFPHLDHEDLPENTMADAEKWARELDNPAYALDDQSAIRVVNGVVDVVSEGHWKYFDA